MRKIIPVVVAGVTTLAVAGGTFAYANASKDVTLSVDGQQSEVTTLGSTVEEVLESRGIEVTERDVVAPAPGTRITDGTRIAVQFGRQVTVTVDGTKQSYWTTATSVGQALTALGIGSPGAEVSTSRSATIGREGLAFDVATVKTLKLNAAGKKRTVQTTAQTVGEALAAANITPDRDDKVSPATTTRLTSGTTITFIDVQKKKVVDKQRIAFDTVRKTSRTLAAGQTRVQTEGRSGVRTVSYTEVRHNGKLKSRKKSASSVTRKPVTRVLLVGTKPATRSGGSGGATGGVWDRLAQCESGGNWSINTGNGFYGGLQFTLSTWRGYGGSGMPHLASREQQIAIAQKVQAGQGWGAWPACSSKLGLR